MVWVRSKREKFQSILPFPWQFSHPLNPKRIQVLREAHQALAMMTLQRLRKGLVEVAAGMGWDGKVAGMCPSPVLSGVRLEVSNYPMGSMYGIFTYIWLIFMVIVGKYTIHGSCGYK